MIDKKVMFVGLALHKNDATGITLSNLFGGWSKDKLLMVADLYNVKLSNEVGYNNTYILSDKEYKHQFPLNIVKSIINIFKQKNVEDLNKNKVGIADKNKVYKRKSFYSILSKISEYFGLNHLLRCLLSEDLKNWIKDNKPDYIYVILSTRHSILLVLELLKVFDIPVIVHIMDDWPTTLVRPGLLSLYWRKKIDNEFKVLLNKSKIRIAISERMAKEYIERYNCKWHYFHNPVDISFWRKSVNNNYMVSFPFTIIYSGRVSCGVDSTLELFALCVDELIKNENYDIRLQIQTNSSLKWEKKYCGVDVSGYIEYDKLPLLLSNADLLLIPYDFDGIGYRFIKYSMPTKVSEYMISGTPILIVAPKSTALSEYASNYNWGCVISENSKDAIKNGLKYIMNNQKVREEYGKKSIDIAYKYHDIKVVQNEFQKLFR